MNLSRILKYRTLHFFFALIACVATIVSAPASGAPYTAMQLKSLHQPVPGGVAVIEIVGASKGKPPTPTAHYLNKPVLVTPTDAGQWVAIVGIPLTAPLEPQVLEVTLGGKKTTQTFTIRDKKYREQRITLKTNKHVDLSPEDLARFEREKKLQDEAYQQFSAHLPSNLLLDRPVKGPLSSPFGLKRFFNDQPRAPHSGLDFAVPTGTPIQAPAAGRVILVGDYFFNGKTVFIDHGQGMISMFCHLSVIGVKTGESIARGQVLGQVGATGRVTGAHLHWNVSLNDARVDPAIFIGMFTP